MLLILTDHDRAYFAILGPVEDSAETSAMVDEAQAEGRDVTWEVAAATTAWEAADQYLAVRSDYRRVLPDLILSTPLPPHY
ncbi:hypothetical protein ACFSM5_20335 [Lacibacterium aquatile]|uniref:Uncharacterized protein n=1 Tax=Lacibacterium aquatile TaxID=1168082 RepID=A0ABW5DWY1_9PROT